MEKETILIIEDDSDIREGVRILLESEKYEIRETENGREGLKLLDEKTDLIILDIMMPGISGIRTCEEIRKISNVPVLFLTAKAQESDKLIGLMREAMIICRNPFPMRSFWGESKHCLEDTGSIAEKKKKKRMRIWK